MGYTKVDNWLFDTVMPAAKPNTFKVVSAIARKTWGWGKEWDLISMDQFHELTGIVGRGTLSAAILDACKHGWAQRENIGNQYRYRLEISTEIVPDYVKEQYGNRTEQYGNRTEISTEIVHTKEKKEIDTTAVFREYENNIGMYSGIISDSIADAVETYGSQMVIDAIHEAVKNNVRKWNYIEAILRNWGVNGRPEKKTAVPSPANGSTADAWKTAVSHASRGDANFADERIKTAVRATGWSQLQTMKPGSYTESELKKRFMEAYNAV